MRSGLNPHPGGCRRQKANSYQPLSDETLTILKNKYGVSDIPFLRGEGDGGLSTMVRRAGRLDPGELKRTGHFFDFINPTVNQNSRVTAKNPHPFRVVPDPADPDNLLSTLTGAQQLAAYGGAGVGGHTLYHSIIPST